MGYRKCPTHGWLATSQYVVSESGETVCPECETPVTGFTFDPPEDEINDEMPAAHERDEYPEVTIR